MPKVRRALQQVSNASDLLLRSVVFWFFAVLAALSAVVWLDRPSLPSPEAWEKYILSLSSGLLINAVASFLFYYLVVVIPERRKRRILKSNFSKMYRRIKKDISYQIVHASRRGGRLDLHADSETIEKILTLSGFRELFEGGREADEGWYAFANAITPESWEYKEIALSLRMLDRQVDYLLHNYNFTDANAFDFFKRLQSTLLRMESTVPDYDGEKVLSSFLWSMFGGWDVGAGYIDENVVERMINEI